MASTVPKVKLNNGREIPILGLGTWGSPPGEVCAAVKEAIKVGYRHIDCAHVYGNEHEVGEGIADKLADGTVKREELFVTSKLWNTFHRADLVRPALEVTLKNLRLAYIDLYLIHWPFAYKEDGELFPKDADEKILFSDVDYLETWKEMEKLVDDGLVKSIGISNFNKRQVERLVGAARIQPAMNQIECHPYLTQFQLTEFCRANGIAVTAYSPLGSPNRPWAQPGEPVLLEDPKILAIAKKYNKSAAQILIRYQIERGNIVIPKSVTKSRIESNFNVFDFNLTKEDVAEISSFDCNGRMVPMTGAAGHPLHPFENDDF